MAGAAERSENGRASFADEWLMEENARYSTLKPSAVCLWGGRVFSSSTFSGGEGVVMAMEERCDIGTVVKESEGRLNFTPLRVCSVEERDDQMGVGIFFWWKRGGTIGLRKKMMTRILGGIVVGQDFVSAWECLRRALKERS